MIGSAQKSATLCLPSQVTNQYIIDKHQIQNNSISFGVNLKNTMHFNYFILVKLTSKAFNWVVLLSFIFLCLPMTAH